MRITVTVAGIVAGALAAISQVVFHVYPPPAYGICIACHARDLVNWLVNHAIGSNLGVAAVSIGAPVLTVVGIILGAFTAAVRNHEFKIKTMKSPAECGIYGFLVMIFALLLGACLIRIVLRIAYGDAMAMIGWVAIMLGVVAGAEFLKWSARKKLKNEEVTCRDGAA